jgi:hypothetical protein
LEAGLIDTSLASDPVSTTQPAPTVEHQNAESPSFWPAIRTSFKYVRQAASVRSMPAGRIDFIGSAIISIMRLLPHLRTAERGQVCRWLEAV